MPHVPPLLEPASRAGSFVDVQFSTDDQCDEGRLPWDHFGAAIWDVERG